MLNIFIEAYFNNGFVVVRSYICLFKRASLHIAAIFALIAVGIMEMLLHFFTLCAMNNQEANCGFFVVVVKNKNMRQHGDTDKQRYCFFHVQSVKGDEQTAFLFIHQQFLLPYFTKK